MTTLSSNLKALRKSHKLNQKELAFLLKISQSAIAHYENGDRQPTIDSLLKFSNLFNVSIDELLGHQVEHKPVDIDKEDFKHDLIELLLDKNEKGFDDKMSYLFKNIKDSQLVEEIVKDVLKLVGSMWEKGEISVSEEHYFSGLFRDAISKNKSDLKYYTEKTGIALASPNEEHTVGLELVASLLKQEGIRLFLLGRNVPYQSLAQMIEEVKPNFILFSITLTAHLNSLTSSIERLLSLDSYKGSIIIGGQSAKYLKHYFDSDRVHIIDNTNDVYQIIGG